MTDNTNSNEIWKDIKGYEGFYQISNFGNVRSLDRKIKYKNNYRLFYGRNLIKIVDTKGYYFVNLKKNSHNEIKRIHRLVAEAFIENPNKFPCINHIDGNKQNNHIDNLEWCSYKHNINEAFRLGLNRYTHKENFKYENKKKIIQYDLNFNIVKKWESICEAARKTNISQSNISRCCNNKQKTAKKYIWKFEEEN